LRTLTLIRHAKSSWEDSSLDDMIRPLSQRGVENTILLGNYLFTEKYFIDKIISSPATRALHTAINIGDWLGYPHKKISISNILYFGKVSKIVNSIQHLKDKHHSVCLVGHEPLISELAEYLCGDVPEKIVTCGILTIEFDVLLWADVNKYSGKMKSFITPKYLHALQQNILDRHK
jgi:phosphohistidine phosphatase